MIKILKNKIRAFLRKLKLSYYKHKIQKRGDRTIICHNCLGGVILHNFNMRFCSPFVNLMIPTSHYIEILNCINDIKTWDLCEITSIESTYPIGLLNGKWEIHFMHYSSFSIAAEKWRERLERMEMHNMYFILVETHSCTYNDLINFDALPYKNKIIVAHKPYPEIKCVNPIKGYDGINLKGEILWPSNRWGGCFYDQVNWLSFLNLI